MKTFKQHINEALDKPYAFNKVNKNVLEWWYRFETADGRTGIIQILPKMHNKIADITFSIDRDLRKTGKGDQFRIFATVRNAIEDFMDNYRNKEEKIKGITFTADKKDGGESRVSLYTAFAKRLAAKYGMVVKKESHVKDNLTFRLESPAHIKEAWVYADNITGEVFKNPSPREWKDHVSGVTQYGVAGFYVKGDVYIFPGETPDSSYRVYHVDVMKKLGIRNTKDVVLFRISLKGQRIDQLHHGGKDTEDILAGRKDDEYQAVKYVELYNHRSLKPHMANNLKKTLEEIISFMGKYQFEEATGIKL